MFENAQLLESSADKYGKPDIKGIHRFYAPLVMDGKVYAVKITVKELNNPKQNNIYSIEGISIETKESELSGLSENLNSSTAIQNSDSVDSFVKNILEVKKNVSKVVDENGEPLVVYHGSPKNFTIFDYNEKGKTNSVVSRIGFWFSPIKSFTTNFVKDAFPFDDAIEYATFLNLRNPKIFSTTKHTDSLLDLGKKIKHLDDEMKALNGKWVNNLNVSYADKEAFLHFRQGLETDSDIIEWFETRTPNGKSAVEAGRTFNNLYKEHKKLSEEYDELRYSDSYEKLKTDIYKLAGYDAQTANFGGVGMAVSNNKQMADKWVENAQAEGFDGVIVKNTTYDSLFAGGENDQLVAFNSNQIKSATGNIGSYSENPDIRFSMGELSDKDIGKSFEETRRRIPYSGEMPPPAISQKVRNIQVEAEDVENWLKENTEVIASDGKKINIANPEGKNSEDRSLLKRAIHIIGFETTTERRSIDIEKLRWYKYIPNTLENAQVRYASPDNKMSYYVKNYGGILHIVVVKNSKAIGHLITQFPQTQKQPRAFLREAVLSAILKQGKAKLDNGVSVLPKDHTENQTRQTSTSSNRDVSSKNRPVSQGNNLKKSSGELSADVLSDRPDLKYIIEQSPESNPIAYASMQFAKFTIINGGKIPQTLIDRLLPLTRFSEFQRSEALEMGAKIAERINAKKQRYADELALNAEIKRTQSDLYWQDVVNRIANEFTETGEWFGRTFAISEELVKNATAQRLKFIKGYEAQDFDVNLVQSLIDAQVDEEQKTKNEESRAEVEDDLDFGDDTLNPPEATSKEQEILSGLPIKEIFARIREEVREKERAKGAETEGVLFGEVLRKTYINILNNLSKELNYGIGRERIKESLANFANVKYLSSEDLTNALYEVDKLKARIKETKDATAKKDLRAEYFETLETLKEELFGYGAGTASAMNFLTENYDSTNIPDNFTIFAESIALRSYRRRVKDDKAELTEKLEKIVKSGGTFNKSKREEKRSISPLAHSILNYAKKVYPLVHGSDAYDAEQNEVQNKLELGGKGYAAEVQYAEAVWQIEVLKRVANWRKKSRGEMADALKWLEQIKEDGVKYIEQLQEKHRLQNEENRRLLARAMTKMETLPLGYKKNAIMKFAEKSVHLADDLDMLSACKDDDARRLTKRFIDKLQREIFGAGSNRDNQIKREIEEIATLIEKAYGKNAKEAFKDLYRFKDDLDEFATQGVKMNKSRLIQLYASCKQEGYRDNVLKHRAKNTKRGLELEKQIATLEEEYPDVESRKADWQGYKKTWEEIDRLERELAKEKKKAVDAFVKKIEAHLSKEDLKFYEMIIDFWERKYEEKSRVNKKITGFDLEHLEDFYNPAVIFRKGGMPVKIYTAEVLGGSMMPRVKHTHDFDSRAGIIDVLEGKIREGAHFVNFAELTVKLRGIFGDGEIQTLIREKMGEEFEKKLLDEITDVCALKLSGEQDPLLNSLNGSFAVMSLGLNLVSGVRQLTSIPAFAMQIGLAKTAKYALEGANFANPEVIEAYKEIWRSETMRRRLSKGNNQALEEMITDLTSYDTESWTKEKAADFARIFRRYALIFNKAGDAIPILLVGQGIYRAAMKTYLEQGATTQQAKELAMRDMWFTCERSQQSSQTIFAPEWSRRWGTLGKMITLFTSSPQLFFSKTLNDLNVARKTGKAEDWRKFAGSLFINHILLSGGYAIATIACNLAMGDDWDEKDLTYLWKTMMFDPFSGMFFFGRFAGNANGSPIPMTRLFKTASDAYNAGVSLISLDEDEILEAFDKLGNCRLRFVDLEQCKFCRKN